MKKPMIVDAMMIPLRKTNVQGLLPEADANPRLRSCIKI